MSPRKSSTGTAEITPEGRAALMEAMEDEVKAVAEAPDVAASEPPAAVGLVDHLADRLDPLHELDRCPIGSKLVGTEQGVVIATPAWEGLLPKTDLAGRLPVGARIQKIGEGVYRSVQLDPAEDRPALITATAYEAVTKFVNHFHG